MSLAKYITPLNYVVKIRFELSITLLEKTTKTYLI